MTQRDESDSDRSDVLVCSDANSKIIRDKEKEHLEVTVCPCLIQMWPAYTVEPVWSPLGHNQLAVIQRWSTYTVEPVYSGYP